MQYRRTIVPGASYFFTVNLQDRTSHLLIDEIVNLRFAFRKTMTHYPFTIEGIVILPDHLHMIMKLPEQDGNFSIRWNMIKGVFSKQIQQTESICATRKKKRERGIWQRRFWEHLIRDDIDYEHHMNYIHYNPVKHGYVSKPTDWPYSSIHKCIRNNVLTAQWGNDKDLRSVAFGE